MKPTFLELEFRHSLKCHLTPNLTTTTTEAKRFIQTFHIKLIRSFESLINGFMNIFVIVRNMLISCHETWSFQYLLNIQVNTILNRFEKFGVMRNVLDLKNFKY